MTIRIPLLQTRIFSITSVVVFVFGLLLVLVTKTVISAETPCGSTPVEFGGIKKLLPAGGKFGRPGSCMRPDKIVLHTTIGSWKTNDEVYQYFASGSDGRGVSSHFIIDETGQVMQIVEMYTDNAEVAYTVAGYNNEQVSIELVKSDVFSGKAEVPVAQYNAAYALVRKLQQAYNIPLGTNEYTYQAPSNDYIVIAPGLYGHYQLHPTNSDPGIGLVRDMREDIKNNAPLSPGGTTSGSSQVTSCVITKVGSPSGSPPPLPAFCSSKSGSIDATSCPIQNARVNCGTLATPVNGCGHCGVGYPYGPGAGTCAWFGTQFGIDIAKEGVVGNIPNEPVYLPKVNGHIVQWTWVYQNAEAGESIQGYSGVDTVTQEKYYLQFHHVQGGSGNKNGAQPSGTQGAVIWAEGSHVHVQIAAGPVLNNEAWLDAAQHFCR